MPSLAEKELMADPVRSNRLIAELIGCDHHVIARARARLERTGTIEPAPVRTPRYPNGPRQLGRAQQAVRDLGPGCTTRQVMQLSGVGRGAAWKARTHPRARPDHVGDHLVPSVADAAAAVDAIAVIRTPAPRIAYRKVTDRPYAPFYIPADPAAELACCTAEYTPQGWQHERSCVMRLAARS